MSQSNVLEMLSSSTICIHPLKCGTLEFQYRFRCISLQFCLRAIKFWILLYLPRHITHLRCVSQSNVLEVLSSSTICVHPLKCGTLEFQYRFRCISLQFCLRAIKFWILLYLPRHITHLRCVSQSNVLEVLSSGTICVHPLKCGTLEFQYRFRCISLQFCLRAIKFWILLYLPRHITHLRCVSSQMCWKCYRQALSVYTP